MDRINPPPAGCDGCGRVVRPSGAAGLAAGAPDGWIRLDGSEATVTLDDGRRAERRGAGWVCRGCGHTVPLSRELAPRALLDAAEGRHAFQRPDGAPASLRDVAPGVQTPLA